jgi:rRNA maturation RNase YbeY
MDHKANFTELHLLTNFEIMPKGKSKVNFFLSETNPFYLKNRNKLKDYIISIFRQENKVLDSISYVFTTEKKIFGINKKYLNHPFFTDIITFDLSEENWPVVADVYISVQRVRENAKTHNTSFKEEIHRVIFHGALHLCGYNDTTTKQSNLMRKKENFYLKKYFS